MCFGEPSKSLAIARDRMTPEAWAKFELEYDDFCVVNGMPRNPGWSIFNWAKWAFLSARPRELVLTEWIPCTTPPVRDGWYEVQRGMQAAMRHQTKLLLGEPERVRFTIADGWDRESCGSKVGVWVSHDCWRGVQGETE